MLLPQSKISIFYGLVAIATLNYLIYVLYSEVYLSLQKEQNGFYTNEEFSSFKILPLKYPNKSFIHYPKCEDFNGITQRNLFITILVRSANENYQRRVAIRKTWGYNKFFTKNEKISSNTIFILGSAKSYIDQMFLDGEFRNFKDILQINAEENYFNKTMVAFKYAVEACQKTHFFLIVDDDYFVGVRNIARFVTNPLEYPGKFTHINVGKKISELTLYAGIVKNEGFVDGAALYSKKALHQIFFASRNVSRFDNINNFIGKVASIAGIDPVHVSAFRKTDKPPSDISFYNDVIAINGFENEEDLPKLWKSLGYKLAKFKF